MGFIEKAIFLEQINTEISKLPNYDPTIKIIDVSVNANGLINDFLPNQFDPDKALLALMYIEQVEHLFNGLYNRLI